MIVLPVDEKQQLAEQDRAPATRCQWEPPLPHDELAATSPSDELPPPSYEDASTSILGDLDGVKFETDALGNISTSASSVSKNRALSSSRTCFKY